MPRPVDESSAAGDALRSEATMRLAPREEAGRFHGDHEQHEDERPDALVVTHVDAEVVVRRGDLFDEPDDHAADHDPAEAAEPTEDRGREPAEHHHEAE